METSHFKDLLEKEKARLERDLMSVGRKNPDNQADWEPTPDKTMDHDSADKNEVADSMEEYETRAAVEVELENRLASINAALKRIEDGTYGKCEEGDEEIEHDRLEANPAATTCKTHMNSRKNQ